MVCFRSLLRLFISFRFKRSSLRLCLCRRISFCCNLSNRVTLFSLYLCLKRAYKLYIQDQALSNSRTIVASIACLIVLLYSAASRSPSSRSNSFSIPLRKSFGVRLLLPLRWFREKMLRVETHCRVFCLSASRTRWRVRSCNSCILGSAMTTSSKRM